MALNGLIQEVYHLLDDIEWCVDLTATSGKDVYGCPVCGGRYMLGIGGEHEEDCRFHRVYQEIEKVAMCAWTSSEEGE